VRLGRLIDRLMLGRPIKDGIPGTATVFSRTRPPQPVPKYIGGAKLNLLVDVPGRETYKVRHKCSAPGDKYPQPGSRIPVVVSRTDPQRLRIAWDRILTADEVFDRL
jgi:hypothetical protein